MQIMDELQFTRYRFNYIAILTIYDQNFPYIVSVASAVLENKYTRLHSEE